VGFHAASLGLGVLQVLVVWSGGGRSWASLQGNGGGWSLSPLLVGNGRGWSSSPLLVSNGVVGSCGHHCRVVVVDGCRGLLLISNGGGGS